MKDWQYLTQEELLKMSIEDIQELVERGFTLGPSSRGLTLIRSPRPMDEEEWRRSLKQHLTVV